MGMTRFSINAILWFGDEMKKFAGVVPGDDEEFMSCIYPTRQGMSNAWNGDAIVAHFAFFTQREQLDRWHILEKYGKICQQDFLGDKELRSFYEDVQSVMQVIQTREAELMQCPSPYRAVPMKKTWRTRIKEQLPQIVQDLLALRNERKKQNGFIVK